MCNHWVRDGVALDNQGRKKGRKEFDGGGNWDCLSVASQSDSSHDDIVWVGELFLLKLHRAIRSKSLAKNHSRCHVFPISPESIFILILIWFGVGMNTPFPPSATAKFHSFRAYHTIQQWQGNERSPTELGWQHREGLLVPIATDRPVGHEKVLKMIHCACKVGCGKSCGCYQAGIECILLCAACYGRNCKNTRTNVSKSRIIPQVNNAELF